MTVHATAKAPAKADIQAHMIDDLRKAWLYAYNHAPVNLIQVVDANRFNTRYARELLGRLTQDGFLVEEQDGDELMWYYRDELFTEAGVAENEEEAQKLFDTWLTSKGIAAPPSPPTATSPQRPKAGKRSIPGSDCLCGCGRPTKANFAPGHDAKFAGEIAREIARTGDMLLADQLPTPQLREKARAHAERLMNKVAAAPPRQQVVEANAAGEEGHGGSPGEGREEHPELYLTYGVVKIGKNRFAARRDGDGVIMRHNKALPNVVIPLTTYTELDYPGTVEGNAAKSFKILEVQP